MAALDRFPVSFRTLFGGNEHRHVVLGVHFNGYYGAIGISRRGDLMYKPLTFRVRILGYITQNNTISLSRYVGHISNHGTCDGDITHIHTCIQLLHDYAICLTHLLQR